MRYLMIDHITEWHSENLIRGVKNITMSEDFLEFHFPDHPVMPGIFLLEALVQLAGWFEAEVSGFRDWVLLRRVVKCGFYGLVFPGDQVALEVMASSMTGAKTKSYKGIGKVNGKKKITALFEGEIVGLSSLEDTGDMTHFFHILTRNSGFLKDA